MLLASFISPILTVPRLAKVLLVITVDISLCVLSTWLAFYLRLGEFDSLNRDSLWAVIVAIAFAIPIFMASGLYRVIFRYSGLYTIVSIVRAISIYGLLYSALFTAIGISGIPRTIGLIQPLLLLFFVVSSRIFASIWLGKIEQRSLPYKLKLKVLIYGAGDAGRQLSAALENSNEMQVVGFIDDNKRLQRQVLNGLPIYSPIKLEGVIKNLNISDVLLALPSTSRQRRNEILKSLVPLKLTVRTLPGLSDLATGRVSISDLRDLDLDDLLGREPVLANETLLNLNTHQKTVLVTGAGGSIGSELCRQILKSRPRQLLLLDISEFALYNIHKELQTKYLNNDNDLNEYEEGYLPSNIEIIPLLASVCDESRIHKIIETWRPDTVYHAAAYKHVPLVEHNPAEGLRNNVWGTKVCAEAAAAYGVKNFVLISTDKAVRPTNIMGASKRLAEMILQAFSQRMTSIEPNNNVLKNNKTIYSMVRFGNVLGSSGSVVPLFREQIKNDGPLSLTHKDITRYFMSIPEAAQLVIQSGAMGTGGDVFVLNMGNPVRIFDLATRLIELSGRTLKDESNPDGDIEIAITGLRPGEKLFEELLIGENPEETNHPRIMKAHEDFLTWDELVFHLDLLKKSIDINDVKTIKSILQDLVHGYMPNDNVVDWIHLALIDKSTSANN